MRRQVLYSGSRRSPGAGRDPARSADDAPGADTAQAPLPAPGPRLQRLRALGTRHATLLLFLGGVACALLITGAYLGSQPRPRALTQQDIDAAVTRTLEKRTLPSQAAKAAEIVRPSVVRVQSFNDATPPKARPKREAGKSGRGAPRGKSRPESKEEGSVGSGVVLVDDGTILTNLHVIFGARRVTVTFHDGSESEADLVSVHPENDLAVIRARTIPDDLRVATLGSAARLKPGDEVVAVGFPFGMGPSVTAGVISGLNREFLSPEGERLLTRLIQFDAAANPGSSGGPLVTMQGDVVGIVTAIMNPTASGTFIGIGFAVTIAVAGRAAGGMHPF